MAQRAAQTWQPQKYLKFEQVRLRPALELLERVPALPAGSGDAVKIVDLGAGTGNMAPSFFKRWSKAHVSFVDSSASMLERAKEEHSANAGVKSEQCAYVQADFETFEPEELVDLIYSNAALHWVSAERHKQLMPRLFSFLKPGGTLAFQMPDSRLQPSHQLMAEAAKQIGHWDHVADVRWVTCERDPDFYYELFKGIDKGVELDMWATVYTQVLEGENPVADFTGSTGLRPFMEALGDPSTAASDFEQKYRELIADAYPKQSDGRTILNFKRVFVVATKAV
ncbi:Trans-aconitate 2-methyltransferase [Phytophthora cinnamomi]|uniref:Trans-aconitate 2-methyltransferase n=1 Tax=Phytophthora cinnamomi TaxID=4785 RepID=UPI00355A0C19|nr:Trans-aconitate 2-methyltransferase [Phytophthora cinnamomi]